MKEESQKKQELVVFSILRGSQCSSCRKELSPGNFLFMEKGQPFCLECADLDHLVFLPSGDAAISRRSKRNSTLWAVVVRFSRSRRRYERQGLLVEESALEKAEEECEADSDLRQSRRESRRRWEANQDEKLAERMAIRIRELFPRIPTENAQRIAKHTAQRNSGRVGRTQGGRSLDEEPLRLAVIAHIRHEFTRYDELLMEGVDRYEERMRVSGQIGAVLEEWEAMKKELRGEFTHDAKTS